MSPDRNRIAHIIFDWDGTILDSAALGYEAFQKTFSDLRIAFDREAYEAIYSPDWYTMYQALGLPRKLWQQADDLWLLHYGEGSPEMISGVMDVLSRLRSRGYIFGIVTSGTKSRVLREIGNLGVAGIFPVVVCNEDISQRKPHPEGLEKAIALLGAVPASSVYVGDSPEDIEMGRSAGVFTVGIKSGYPNSRRLTSANPDLCLECAGDLLLHF